MNKKNSDLPKFYISLYTFFSLFIFYCIILCTTIIGSTKEKISPGISCIIGIFSFLFILTLVFEAKRNDNEAKEKLIKEKNTKKENCYRFVKRKNIYVIFDSDGYVTDAKGFGFLMWFKTNSDIDKALIGRHVNEVANILKDYAASKEIYYNFEKEVHLELLKEMLNA